ncbi:MAG: aldo/keto reductase [Lachnospiraceae bacterium]|nr:aldo/keto reductase [Lachnospiraceae bacterium]
MKSINDCYTLSNGVEIPCVGFGTYKAAEKDNADIIRMAIDAGYRYFDTASFYGTEPFVAKAIESSGIEREKFFLTSKVWKDEMGYDATKKALERTLWNLKTDYLDLYLIHWPLPTPDSKDWKELDIATWKAMEELYKEGKVRAIGLSNFLPHHIMNIQKNCEVEPMVNQIEFHPGYTQETVLRFCRENDILVQAWSPLGRQRVLKDALVTELAEKYQVSSARLCLRFALQKGVILLPKASAMERMKENQDIFSFNIEETDMYRLETMPQTGWSGEHPDRVRMVLN